MHWPAATVPVQLSVPSVTVTFPVGVPLPGGFAVTVKETTAADPMIDGFGFAETIVVVVGVCPTSCGRGKEVLVK